MAKRRTKDEIREEYLRLVKCWDVVRAFEIERFKADEAPEEVMQSLPTGDYLVAEFDEGKYRPSELLAGLKQGLMEGGAGLIQVAHLGKLAIELIDQYENETGRNFVSDCVDYKAEARRAVKRGKIKNETEFYALKEVMSQVDQTLFLGAKAIQAERLLKQFEIGEA